MFALFSFSAIIFVPNHSGPSYSNESGETSLSASLHQLWTRHHHLLLETDQGVFAGAGQASTRGGTGQGGQQGDELGEEQDQQQHRQLQGDEGQSAAIDVARAHPFRGHAAQIKQGEAEGGRQEGGLQVGADHHAEPEQS